MVLTWRFLKNSDPTYKYDTAVVVSVNLNTVEVQSSNHTYDGISGIRKDIYNGKAKKAFYYSDEITSFHVRELMRFYEDGALFSVNRK